MQYNLPAFLPDKLPTGEVLTQCINVYPAENGYRAAKRFQEVSDALPDAFKGGASFIASDGTASLLVGTASTLSRLASGVWTDLLSGLTINGRWRFVQFGDFAFCVNGGATYQVNLVTQTASAISGAPTAIDCTVVGDYVVVAQPNGNQLRVGWSAFNDHTAWTIGVDQAGEQTMLAGGEVMGVAGGEYGVILQRNRLVRMDRTGDSNAPFAFDAFGENFGCASKASIAVAARTVFYLSDRGFVALEDGQSIRQIGNEKFDQSFKDALGEDEFERLYSTVDPERTCVYWAIPGATGRVWGYNWALDRAFTLDFAHDGIFAGFENSIGLEEYAALYSNIDTAPFSLDDPRFRGGAPRLYVVQGGKVGTLTGANLRATFRTGDVEPNPGRRTRVRAVWPDTDATAGITISLTQQQQRGNPGITRTSGALQESGRMPLQANGRYFECTITIDDPAWSYVQGFEFEQNVGALR